MNVKRINITVDEYVLDMLDKFAKPRSISRSQLIRLAIPEYIRNHTYTDEPVPVLQNEKKKLLPLSK